MRWISFPGAIVAIIWFAPLILAHFVLSWFIEKTVLQWFITLVLWALYMRFVAKKTTLEVPLNYVYIWQDPLTSMKFEAHDGLNPYFPWVDTWDFEVDMQFEVPVRSDPDEDYATLDGAQPTVDWMTLMRPRRGSPSDGYILRWVDFDDKARVAAVKAEMSQWFSDRYARTDVDDILANKKALSAEIAEIFGGENTISPIEDKYGMELTDPVLNDTDLDEATQKSRATIGQAQNLRKSADELRKGTDITHEKALDDAMAIGGFVQAERNVFKVEGLPDGLKVLAPGGIFGTGGGGKDKGKGKK